MRILKHITALLACSMFFVSGHAVQLRREPGSRIPEYVLPTDHDNISFWANRSAIKTKGAPSGYYATTTLPRTGSRELVLVLVDFNNRKFTVSDTTALLKRYQLSFSGQGYRDTALYSHKGVVYHGATGSVSDYFKDQSYGRYTPKFRIAGPVHPSQGYDYYGRGDKDINMSTLIREVCDTLMVNGILDLRGYAQNGDLYQFCLIYAGKGANYEGGETDAIWPHASSISYNKYGIKEIGYICSCELFWDSDSIPDGIGTFCHEFSHTLGLPDFYNTSNESLSETDASMGFWSIMDYGNYENGGFSPVGYTAFEKYSLGWLEPEEITYAGNYILDDITCMPDSSGENHPAYRISTGNDDQFIILENHSRTGWYKYHAAEGLMVTAVDYNSYLWTSNKVNGYTKHYSILPADNDYSRTSNAGDLFPYNGKDSISTIGKPKLKAGSSYPLFNIYNITRNGNRIAFKAGYDLPSGITSQSQDVSISINDEGILSVTAPEGRSVTVYDMSGKAVFKSVITSGIWQTAIPGHGIWIVNCGGKTRKVRF